MLQNATIISFWLIHLTRQKLHGTNNNNINNNTLINAVSSININGALSNCNQTTAHTFNKYFATVAQDILAANTKNGNAAFINNNPLNYLFSAFNQSFPSIKLKFVSTKEIEDITKSLKSKDSHGYDEIQTKMLKASIPYISSPLTCLCNWLLPSGIFHSRLKFSEIKQLFKKGDKLNISKYRLISILTYLLTYSMEQSSS